MKDIKIKLMKCAMCSDFTEFKKIYYENKRGWILLCDIFIYSCDTMNINLLEMLYEIFENMDKSISRYNQPKIFYKSILYNNTLFYNKLLSYEGCLYIYNNNINDLIDYTITERCHFNPILQLLKNDDIKQCIQMITEDAIISYNENVMRIKDNEYMNNNNVYMVYQSTDNVTEYIPLSVKDDQYIKFLQTLIDM